MNDAEGLARLLDAIRPWSQALVIVGGWAHRLYRLHHDTNVPAHQPLVTRDVDLAVGGRTLRGNIGKALEDANFHEVLSSDHIPPVSQYRLGDEDGAFYAEFLAPLKGGPLRRDGSANATLAIAGVTAQKLRHLDLLLVAPWTVRASVERGVPVSAPIDILIPNAVAFLAQKLLIREERRPEKRPQDLLYIHDTLEMFGAHAERLRALWRERVCPALSRKSAAKVETLAIDSFSVISDDIRRAARIPADRVLTPEGLRALCAYGMEEIFRG